MRKKKNSKKRLKQMASSKFFRFDSLDRVESLGVLFNLLSSSFCSLPSIALQPTTQVQWPEMPRRQSTNPLPSPWFSSRETRLRNQQRPSKMTMKFGSSSSYVFQLPNFAYVPIWYNSNPASIIKEKTQKQGTGGKAQINSFITLL